VGIHGGSRVPIRLREGKKEGGLRPFPDDTAKSRAYCTRVTIRGGIEKKEKSSLKTILRDVFPTSRRGKRGNHVSAGLMTTEEACRGGNPQQTGLSD